ncbi:hypothetical protein HPB52_024950 [Rhipicephalus sanguineus]|uniref:Carboxylic ester hydrolase n=1 Tax=Rhipicephalus sanguineus TaxID=34632 RepID=A0A9D4P8W9_RHISA|nr:hypothetical protein HPB52_024950 [Rhipicephalus sanguineus]
MACNTWILGAFVFTVLLCATEGGSHVERQTTEGRVHGRIVRSLGRSVEEFRGIPYAEPPVGKLRFRPPQPKKPWEGTLDATSGSTGCPQVTIRGVNMQGVTNTEDCLYLNVWVPENASNADSSRPVLVWIHGGGFSYGSANQALYSAVVLTALTDVLVVSINYRLGILGFLNAYSPEAPGNVGLLDQVMALKWVKRNIEFFGGDPQRVTIFGQSAGSMSVHAHIMSPMSQGLFKRAVLMSGVMYGIDMWDTVQESVAKGDRVASMAGCLNGRNISSDPEGVIDCLRNKSAEELVVAAAESKSPMESLPDWMGPPHSSDLSFVFGERYAAEPASRDGRMSEIFMRMVATFSENGNGWRGSFDCPQRRRAVRVYHASPDLLTSETVCKAQAKPV